MQQRHVPTVQKTVQIPQVLFVVDVHAATSSSSSGRQSEVPQISPSTEFMTISRRFDGRGRGEGGSLHLQHFLSPRWPAVVGRRDLACGGVPGV